MSSLAFYLNQQPLLAIVLMLVLGKLLGNLTLFGIGLGTSGILFVAMALGHWGVQLPAILGELGVVLFVYAVGLRAGPHFVNTIRRRGISFLILAITTLCVGWILTYGLARWFETDPALAAGIFSGAFTSTPGLAASLQVLKDPNVSVGFGVAYPIGVVGVILFVQLTPRILRLDWGKEIERAEANVRSPEIIRAWIRIANPQIDGMTIQEVEAMHMTGAKISRVFDTYVAMPPHAKTHLAGGQHVRVVGTEDDLRRLELMLGPRVTDFEEPRSAITSATLVVTENEICSKSLKEMQFRERHGVTVTRIVRDNFEFVPGPKTTLEFGDEIRVVGDEADCHRITGVVGHQAERLHETRFLPLGIGLLVGVVLGQISIPILGGSSVSLGLAGGPLVAGLIGGHFGRIGKINFRMPVAARMFINELGLVLFLGSAGAHAGEYFWQVMQNEGSQLLTMAVIVMIVPLICSYLLSRIVFRWDALTSLGAMCGAMTSTPGLGVVAKIADSSAPSTAYVAVYPMALLTISLLAPFLGTMLGK